MQDERLIIDNAAGMLPPGKGEPMDAKEGDNENAGGRIPR
jgi:hypothetical protein